MYKIISCVVLLLLTAGCVAMDESGIEGAIGVEGPFGPASVAGLWKGESNWDGTVKEIKVLVRKPVIEKMVTPTPQAPVTQPSDGTPAPAPAPVWEKVTDKNLNFWGWDIFIKGSEKELFVNIQIIFKDDGQGTLVVVSQTGGTGNARFIQEGAEKRIELDLAHPMFKEIKGRILCGGDRINGSFTLLGKEGIFKLEKDKTPSPATKEEVK